MVSEQSLFMAISKTLKAFGKAPKKRKKKKRSFLSP
tara:strand:+ start:832 stop:939 length:108 start_codon:yes stop_codon:yes gene_type:complete